ncbi:hypothetical protein PMAYCL1PPCAC_27378, partial [Pristionchus mayeri]
TLQNDPPNLETNAYMEDQYKAYGQSFRTLITDCLQKDPAKRPTATELLKYKFFSKAKDKKYLVHSLIKKLSSVPSSPAQNPHRRMASGKKKKAPDGNWEFEYDSTDATGSSDEEKDGCKPAADTSFKGLEGNVINLV